MSRKVVPINHVSRWLGHGRLEQDVELQPLGFRVQGEAVWASVDIPPNLSETYASNQRGLYLDVLRDFGQGWLPTMPSSFFTAGVRFDVADFDTSGDRDEVDQFTVGLNFRPTADTVFKLDYLRGRSFDGFNNRGDHAAILFSVATYF